MIYCKLLEHSLTKLIKEEYPCRKEYYVYIFNISIFDNDTIDISLSYGADGKEINSINIIFSIKYKWNFNFIKGLVLGTIVEKESKLERKEINEIN